MCGFVGALTKDILSKNHISNLINMNKMIAHRGPDNEGLYQSKNYACAFSRLSIIDINNRSNQPFTDSKKRFYLVYNGEIYNFLELRSELINTGIKFATSSDTEVLFQSFIKWGPNCVNKFIGMFAFVIFDKKLNELHLFRDQLGIKPIYYKVIDNIFFFSSEIKTFKKISQLSLNINKLTEYATWGSILGEDTLLNGIKQIEPGNYLTIDSNLNLKKNTYFDLKDTFSTKDGKIEIERLEDQIKNNIIIHTRSDVDYGTQLSGGLDSSFITAVASSYQKDLKDKNLFTFSTRLENQALDETKYQLIVSERYNTNHQSYLYNNNDIKKYINQTIWMYDYPLHHPNIISSLLMNQLAKKNNLKVLLSGDGADELFSGYFWDFAKKNKSNDYDDLILSDSYLPYELSKNLFNIKQNDLESRYKLIQDIDNYHTARSLLNQRCYLDKWLQRQDRAGMFASVEIRVPYCNVELFKTINSINFNDKTQNGKIPKFLLKEIAKKYLPNEIIQRKKIGFSIPLEDWFRDKNGLGSLLTYLKDDIFTSRSLYNHKFINSLIESHLNNKNNYGRALWMLINIELWHRIFID